MNYIVLDLEWNYPMAGKPVKMESFVMNREVIEIGAVRLNNKFEPEDEFRSFIHPSAYPILNPLVNALTKIRGTDLANARSFPQVFEAFIEWCGDDFAFLTWGPEDLVVLMDNLIYHGMPSDFGDSYDLQRIFGHEIMGDDRQHSLENALSIMQLPQDRAHDALNDARSTARLCKIMDLPSYLVEYFTRYIDYEDDRMLENHLNGYRSRKDMLLDSVLTEFVCPSCGARLRGAKWTSNNSPQIFGYAKCPENIEYLLSIRSEKNRETHRFLPSRRVFEMSDDLWDRYQNCLGA